MKSLANKASETINSKTTKMYKKCIVESNAKIGTLELFVRCSSQHTIQCVGATSQSLVELVMSKQLVNQPRDPKYVRDSVYIEE